MDVSGAGASLCFPRAHSHQALALHTADAGVLLMRSLAAWWMDALLLLGELWMIGECCRVPFNRLPPPFMFHQATDSTQSI